MARLTNIVTRTGDNGGADRARRRAALYVSKDSPRIWAMGTVDELRPSSNVGPRARAWNTDPAMETWLRAVQQDLFDLGAELATPSDKFVAGMPGITKQS